MENEQVTFALYLEYFFLVFIAALGVLQIAAIYAGMRGLSFFSRTSHGFVFAGLTVIPALVGLFTWNQRNPTAVVEGLQQFYFFSLATFLAFVFTVLVSHLIQRSKLQGNEVRYDGLEALKKATFFQALQHKLSRKR